MKVIKTLAVITLFQLISCNKSDEGMISCNRNCNVFKGRVYTEDQVGIPNVAISVYFYSSNPIGPDHRRLVGKSNTDATGNYIVEGFIKDEEFTYGYFYLTIDDTKIENSLADNFLKPSELYEGGYDDINKHYILNLTNRAQVITADYKIPYKTNLVVHLNDFYPTIPNDTFGVANLIKYGFEDDYRFLIKQSNNLGCVFSNGVTTTFTVPCVYGDNNLRIYKYRNGISENIDEFINVPNPNTTPPLNYSF